MYRNWKSKITKLISANELKGAGPDKPGNNNDLTGTGEEDGVLKDHIINCAAMQDNNTAGSETVTRSRVIKKALFLAGALILLLMLTGGIFLLVFYYQIQETQQVVLDQDTNLSATWERENTIDEEEAVRNQIFAEFPDHIVNIGLLGFDRGWGREDRGHYMFRPDVQAVISIDFEKDQVSVIRIPRDSYVPIHGAGGFHDKINHSYMYGYYAGGGDDQNADGIRYTLMTISDVLGGIPIHYYISVDMYSVVALVYVLGGIHYEVEERIVDKVWVYGVLLPPIEPGYQLLDGTNYMRILQYRDAKSGQDHGRIERQSKLLTETYHYLRKKGKITDIPAFYRIYKEYVDTDLSNKKISALANYFLQIDLTDENLHFFTFQGATQMKDGVYYEVIDQEQRLEIIEEVFGLIVDPWPPIVLKDSPEYIREQERKKRMEEGGGLIPQFPAFEDMRKMEDFFYQQSF